MIKYLYFAVPVHALHAIYCGPYDIKSKMNKLNYLKKKLIPNQINNQHILYFTHRLTVIKSNAFQNQFTIK